MVILGLNIVFHDSAACIVKDGELLIAIEEERLNRQKHTPVFPHRAIQRCLEETGLTLSDIDHVAASFKPSPDLWKKVLYALGNFRHAHAILNLQVMRLFWKRRTLRQWHLKTFSGQKHKPTLNFVPHDESHIVGSFLVSPYRKAALLSLGDAQEWVSGFVGVAEGKKVNITARSYYPHSLGAVYSAVTWFCGFKPGHDEGRTMGLAPFGDPQRFYNEVKDIVQVSDSGGIRVDLSYFRFQNCQYDNLSPKFIERFGKPRHPHAELQQYHKDVAAAFQLALEEAALKLCAVLRKRTDADYLVIAGGVALNSVMNGRILRESGFRDFYVMPGAGDNGTAIGAAYCVYNNVLGHDRARPHMNPYLGTEYDNDQIRSVLDECKLRYQYHENIEEVTAGLLREGRIIAWFQGRMEIGSGALGSRSILADPTRPQMKDKINAEVKHRESYRPFAPAVAKEDIATYFDIEVEAPFMLKVCDVREEYKGQLPAITHVDGSARVQSVRQELNPRFHNLLKAFGKYSGIPVLLNTSFNVMGEPIVESPYHAIRCFFSTGLDCLVIGNYLVDKSK